MAVAKLLLVGLELIAGIHEVRFDCKMFVGDTGMVFVGGTSAFEDECDRCFGVIDRERGRVGSDAVATGVGFEVL